MSKQAPTRLDKVQSQVLAYHRKMNAIAAFLRANNAGEDLLIDPGKEYVQFFIDRPAFNNMMAMWALKGADCIGVYLGLANQEGAKAFGTTGCFVALDANKKVVAGHFPETLGAEPLLKAEDTWIPPGGGGLRMAAAGELTLATDIAIVSKQFEK